MGSGIGCGVFCVLRGPDFNWAHRARCSRPGSPGAGRELFGKEYDICSQCWSALAEKLSGKGRVNKSREIVLLPPLRVNEREDDEPKPTPGEPPKIWGVAERPN